MPHRQWIDRQLAALNPEQDHARMVDLMLNWRDAEPFLHHLMYTLAFVHQVGDPAIAAIVARRGAGPLLRATMERADETLRFFGTWYRHGPDSAEGRASIDRMNAIHARFPITQEQLLYTLATLVVLPHRVYAMLGSPARPQHERVALLRFWQRVGQAMHLQDIPADIAAFEALYDRYEATHFAPSNDGQQCVEALTEEFAQRWYPQRLQHGRHVLWSLMDPRVRSVFKLPYPGALATRWYRFTLLMQGARRALAPQPSTPRYVTESFARKRSKGAAHSDPHAGSTSASAPDAS